MMHYQEIVKKEKTLEVLYAGRRRADLRRRKQR